MKRLARGFERSAFAAVLGGFGAFFCALLFLIAGFDWIDSMCAKTGDYLLRATLPVGVLIAVALIAAWMAGGEEQP